MKAGRLAHLRGVANIPLPSSSDDVITGTRTAHNVSYTTEMESVKDELDKIVTEGVTYIPLSSSSDYVMKGTINLPYTTEIVSAEVDTEELKTIVTEVEAVLINPLLSFSGYAMKGTTDLPVTTDIDEFVDIFDELVDIIHEDIDDNFEVILTHVMQWSNKTFIKQMGYNPTEKDLDDFMESFIACSM